jgi:hypothetical protein
MKIRSAWLIGGIIAIIFSACSKKTTPASGTAAKKTDSAYVKNPAKIKTAVPKVIVVNDNAASKTFDGRYYYDLAGRRYWRSNKDGKYYLYNKSMQNNEAFKVKAKQ